MEKALEILKKVKENIEHIKATSEKYNIHSKFFDAGFKIRVDADEMNCCQAIAELEEDMKPKSCDGCKWLAVGRYCTLPTGNHCIRNADDYFEKDTQC